MLSCIGQAEHGISVFGYGTDSTAGKDYWLLRNSWGANWVCWPPFTPIHLYLALICV
jgi:hypothetical protein